MTHAEQNTPVFAACGVLKRVLKQVSVVEPSVQRMPQDSQAVLTGLPCCTYGNSGRPPERLCQQYLRAGWRADIYSHWVHSQCDMRPIGDPWATQAQPPAPSLMKPPVLQLTDGGVYGSRSGCNLHSTAEAEPGRGSENRHLVDWPVCQLQVSKTLSHFTIASREIQCFGDLFYLALIPGVLASRQMLKL